MAHYGPLWPKICVTDMHQPCTSCRKLGRIDYIVYANYVSMTCTSRLQLFSLYNKKYIFRGGRGFDPYPVATVNVKPWSWRGSVQVKLGFSEQVS